MRKTELSGIALIARINSAKSCGRARIAERKSAEILPAIASITSGSSPTVCTDGNPLDQQMNDAGLFGRKQRCPEFIEVGERGCDLRLAGR